MNYKKDEARSELKYFKDLTSWDFNLDLDNREKTITFSDFDRAARVVYQGTSLGYWFKVLGLAAKNPSEANANQWSDSYYVSAGVLTPGASIQSYVWTRPQYLIETNHDKYDLVGFRVTCDNKNVP